MTTRQVRRDRDGGFTLIELLVVLIIIGVLASIAIPVFLNQRDKALASATKQTMRNIVPDVVVARDNKQLPLSQITGTCSNCACRNLANPLKVSDPAFAATACGASFSTFVDRFSAATGTPPATVAAFVTDAWGYPMLPDENEGDYSPCGTASDVFISGGKDHIVMGTSGDDINFHVHAGGYCFG